MASPASSREQASARDYSANAACIFQELPDEDVDPRRTRRKQTSLGHDPGMLVALAMAGLFVLTMWTPEEAFPIAEVVWP